MSNIHLFGLRMSFILKHKSCLAKKCITLTLVIDVTSLMWVGVLEKPVNNSDGMLYGIQKASESIMDCSTSPLP